MNGGRISSDRKTVARLLDREPVYVLVFATGGNRFRPDVRRSRTLMGRGPSAGPGSRQAKKKFHAGTFELGQPPAPDDRPPRRLPDRGGTVRDRLCVPSALVPARLCVGRGTCASVPGGCRARLPGRPAPLCPGRHNPGSTRRGAAPDHRHRRRPAALLHFEYPVRAAPRACARSRARRPRRASDFRALG
jgi:hypothetical protein